MERAPRLAREKRLKKQEIKGRGGKRKMALVVLPKGGRTYLEKKKEPGTNGSTKEELRLLSKKRDGNHRPIAS